MAVPVRDPDGTTRVRGLSAPDRARNFFKTDIPFDSYNTDRVDLNRGANSFLFGLGSPAGLINSGLVTGQDLIDAGLPSTGNIALDTYTEWKSIYVDFSGRLQRAQIDNQ